MLSLCGVDKSYNNREILREIDLEIPPNKTSVLIGPSGSGKSTILRIIIGLIQADCGAVRLDGEEIGSGNIMAIRHRMGYVIQEGGLFPHLTARGNVSLLARHLGWNDDRIGRRVDELAELTHLRQDELDRFPAQLSGGQRQRVSLIRALMLDPEVLLLDEPLGALDPMIRSDLQMELREIFRSLQKTVVLVTHDISEAGFFGDLIVLLRDGRIVQQGKIGALLSKPADEFVTRFINAQRPRLQDGESFQDETVSA